MSSSFRVTYSPSIVTLPRLVANDTASSTSHSWLTRTVTTSRNDSSRHVKGVKRNGLYRRNVHPGRRPHPHPDGLRCDAVDRPRHLGPPRTGTLRSPYCAPRLNHVDTSDLYGLHEVNRVIREALHPYSKGLHLVTKVGYRAVQDGRPLAARPLGRGTHESDLRQPREPRPGVSGAPGAI